MYDQRGYELALKAAVPDETHDAASWKRWMPGRRTSRPAGPAVRVTADIGPSLGNIDVALSITTKARAEHRAMPYKGVNAFFDRGIDDIARLAIARFREDDHGAAAAGALQYRPARTLLSHHLDAVRIFWRAHDAWTRLDLGAERDLQRALEIDADFALARLTLGEIRIFQMRMKPAIDEIRAGAADPGRAHRRRAAPQFGAARARVAQRAGREGRAAAPDRARAHEQGVRFRAWRIVFPHRRH